MTILSKPLGFVLSWLSGLFNNNFAVSVIVFTLLVNLVMLPLTFKSQKSTAKQAKLKPKLDALKKKCGDDKQKYNREMSELYAKEGVSMSGGCFPIIVRLIIMIGVYYAVASPFTYVVGINKNALRSAEIWTQTAKVTNDTGLEKNYTDSKYYVSDETWAAAGLEEVMSDPSVAAAAEETGYAGRLTEFAKLHIVSNRDSIADGDAKKAIKDAYKSAKVTREVEIRNYVTGDNKSEIVSRVFEANKGKVSDIERINFDLFGIDLTEIPSFSWNFSNFNLNWLIPIASFVTAMLSSIVTMVIQKKSNPGAPGGGAMMLIMPIFSLIIAFGVPGAVGFYWACSSFIAGGLQALTQILYGPNTVIAKEQASSILKRAETEKARMSAVDSQADK